MTEDRDTHCWHWPSHTMAERVATCCGCGLRYYPKETPPDPAQHGPFLLTDAMREPSSAPIGPCVPPAAPAPTVVVSEEALTAYRSGWGSNDITHDATRAAGLRLAFPILLRDNAWAVDAEIRRRVAKIPDVEMMLPKATYKLLGNVYSVPPQVLLAALGVTPDAGDGR